MAEAFHLERIRERLCHGQFRLSKNATKQTGLRGWTIKDLNQSIVGGDFIREDPEQKPHPEGLVLGYQGQPDDPCYARSPVPMR
jgi:hypothetical protein